MEDHTREQESALLDLDSLTVLQVPPLECPFQDIADEKGAPEAEDAASAVAPDDWLAE